MSNVPEQGAKVPDDLTAADIEAALTGSFAAQLKAEALDLREETKEFPFRVADRPGQLSVTIVARRVVNKQDVIRASRQSDAAFIIEVTDHLILSNGKDTQTKSWGEAQQMMGLNDVEVTPAAVVGGNDTLVSDVAGDILSWQKAEFERQAASLGR